MSVIRKSVAFYLIFFLELFEWNPSIFPAISCLALHYFEHSFHSYLFLSPVENQLLYTVLCMSSKQRSNDQYPTVPSLQLPLSNTLRNLEFVYLKPDFVYVIFSWCFIVSRLGYFRKVWGFLLYPWKFQTKQGLASRNSTKFCYTSQKFEGLKPRPNSHHFFLIAPRNFE